MCVLVVLFFNVTATTAIYPNCHTLSLHDARPVSAPPGRRPAGGWIWGSRREGVSPGGSRVFVLLSSRPEPAGRRAGTQGHGQTRETSRFSRDRKSTRLNSSH